MKNYAWYDRTVAALVKMISNNTFLKLSFVSKESFETFPLRKEQGRKNYIIRHLTLSVTLSFSSERRLWNIKFDVKLNAIYQTLIKRAIFLRHDGREIAYFSVVSPITKDSAAAAFTALDIVGRYIPSNETDWLRASACDRHRVARSRFPSITFLISCRSRANLRLAGGPFPLCLHSWHYYVTRKCRTACYRIPENRGRANARFACEIWNCRGDWLRVGNRCVKETYDRWPSDTSSYVWRKGTSARVVFK